VRQYEGENLLEIEHLSVGYRGGVVALDDVSLTVPDGTVLAVLGANGAGKSTLLRAISGVLGRHNGSVLDGSIRYEGSELVGRNSSEIVRAGIVQVPEGRRIFSDLTVDENLRIGAHVVSPGDRAERLEEVHELFPILGERRHGRAGLLSGGEQQMLAFGRAMVARPSLLLLDEPSLGLAPRLVAQIGELITTINAAGTSVLLIEQNAAMGLEVADEALVIEVGKVRMSGPADELAATDEIQNWYLGGTAASIDTDAAGDDEPDGVDEPDVDDAPSGSEDSGRSTKPARTAEPLVATGITMRFGGVVAVDEVDLELHPGQIHALIGPNGAGKSTFINVVSGVLRPTVGTVRRGDVDLTRTPAHKLAGLGIARTFQNLSLSPEANVLDSILVGRHHLMRSGILTDALRLPGTRREYQQHRRIAEDVAEEVGVRDLLDTRISELPYGDRKRVELARAISSEPDILLLDEPVAGMTHGESAEMAEAIRSAHRRHGFSVLLVEHDMSFVMGLADVITVLDFGARIAHGSPTDVQNDPAVQAAYLGKPAA
jgi:ABC-type branched-subunit amino acid transport system ATPase component